MMKPGVQYPHCVAPQDSNAACSGCASPLPATPSTVVTFVPSAHRASVRHDSVGLPSMCTVQHPHEPWSHPRFVPTFPRSFRRTSSSTS